VPDEPDEPGLPGVLDMRVIEARALEPDWPTGDGVREPPACADESDATMGDGV
jgi:hypothetical protein